MITKHDLFFRRSYFVRTIQIITVKQCCIWNKPVVSLSLYGAAVLTSPTQLQRKMVFAPVLKTIGSALFFPPSAD